MPLYDFACPKCGIKTERFLPLEHQSPSCECGEVMDRKYNTEFMQIKMGYPQWVNRMDDIHKRQADRGERLKFVHPREIGAT